MGRVFVWDQVRWCERSSMSLTAEIWHVFGGWMSEKLTSMAPPPTDVDLVKLVGALAEPESLDELSDAFTGIGRVLSVPMYGFYVLEPGTDRITDES